MDNDKLLKVAGFGLLVWLLLKKKDAAVEDEDPNAPPKPPDATNPQPNTPIPPIVITTSEKRRMLQNYVKSNNLGWLTQVSMMTALEIDIMHLYIFVCLPDPKCKLSDELILNISRINNKYKLRIRL